MFLEIDYKCALITLSVNDQDKDPFAMAYESFSKRYGGRYIFYIWLYPILKAPRWIAISWGAMATLLGRALNGDLIRGIAFALNKLKSSL